MCLTQAHFVRSIKCTDSIDWCYVSGKIWPIPWAHVYKTAPNILNTYVNCMWFLCSYSIITVNWSLKDYVGKKRGGGGGVGRVFNLLIHKLSKTKTFKPARGRICDLSNKGSVCSSLGTSYKNSDSFFWRVHIVSVGKGFRSWTPQV